ncbi:hypothetical protein [Maribacter sp. 1_MG-2023]|uniref:hypothetical protein n=1 Tax=Maribacter sp. 1_MG-2023 TaxID=3062677 RepID=UPI0026E340A5|nr:hypothetical protein [Maribacter sp. 1_MG-2023]MDO6471002.1 hypothetical protein [Maribacter sp. 1_MG-2023]
MRIIRILVILSISILVFDGCRIKEKSINPDAINVYIGDYINNQKYDIRLYDPPPPPQWKDSLKHIGRMKPDSIVSNLVPLKIYIDLEIKFDSNFLHDQKLKRDFSFMDNNEFPAKNFLLEKIKFDEKKGVELEFLSSEEFFKKQDKIQFNEDYGGFISFRNLYYSKDGKKAVFEMNFYKRRLNSSSSIIYAKKLSDGSWKYQSELKSIS